MMVSMLASALCVYLPAWYLSTGLGNDGLWFAFTLFNAARGMTLGWCYLRFTQSHRWLAGSRGPVA